MPPTTRISRPLVVGMSSCKKRVGTLPRRNPKMHKQQLRFLPALSGIGGKAPCRGIRKAGSDNLGSLEREEQVLL